MPLGLGGSPYWTPGQANDYGNTPWGNAMLEQNPSTAIYRYGRTMGVPDDNSGFARWFGQQAPRINTGYNAYTVSNPLTANIQDYLGTLGGYDDWMRRYLAEAPQLRGESRSRAGAGPMRWSIY